MNTCLIKSIGKGLGYTLLCFIGSLTMAIVVFFLSILAGYLVSLSPYLWNLFHFWIGDKPPMLNTFYAVGELILMVLLFAGIFIAIVRSQYKKCKNYCSAF